MRVTQRSRLALALGVGLGSFLVVAQAAAQETPPPEAFMPKDSPPPAKPPPPGESAKDRAVAKAKQAAELAQNGRFADAASLFQESLNIHPLTDVYYNLGYCYEQLGNWKGCVTNYKTYIDAYHKAHHGADPSEIISVRRSIEKCRETAQPPITIGSTPSGAQVGLGAADRIIGMTPLTKKLEPGTYKIFVTKKGFKPVETQIVIQPKQAGQFHFDLQEIVNAGKVQVVVNVREATIYIDGKNYGISPYLETPDLAVGTHQLVVKKDRYASVNTSFTVKQDEIAVLSYDMFLEDPPPSWRSYLGWAAVSIGLVSVAGGVVASRFADQEFNDTEDFDKLVLLQNVGYGAGGGLLGVGTVLLIWEAFSDSVDSSDLVGDQAFQFWVSPTRDGVWLQGEMRF